MYLLREISEYIGTRGWKSLIKGAIRKIRGFLFTYNIFEIGYIDLQTIPEKLAEIPVSIRSAQESDLGRMRFFKFNMKEFRSWLNPGYIFKIVEYKGKIIGYLSVNCSHPERPFQGTRMLKPDEAWLIYVFIVPECRQKHVFQHMMSVCGEDLMGRGYRHLYLAVGTQNRIAMKGYRKAGFKTVFQAKYLQILGIEKTWVVKNT
jgi:ribosomal protein S18 acetylase RimI-like enzyme